MPLLPFRGRTVSPLCLKLRSTADPSGHFAAILSMTSSSFNQVKAGRCSPNKQVRHKKLKGPEIDGLGAVMGAVRVSYAAADTTRAALAALAALFFSRLTLAQRFC
jgi:tripartite-type tricarboxylate transporter receptor subunit TctC